MPRLLERTNPGGRLPAWRRMNVARAHGAAPISRAAYRVRLARTSLLYRRTPAPPDRSTRPCARRSPTWGYATQSGSAGKRARHTRHLARLRERSHRPDPRSLLHSLDGRALPAAAALPQDSPPAGACAGYALSAPAAAAAPATSGKPEARRMAFSISRQRAWFSRSACLAASRPCASRSSL